MPQEVDQIWFQDDQALLGISPPSTWERSACPRSCALAATRTKSHSLLHLALGHSLKDPPLLPLLGPHGLQLLCSIVRSSLKLFPYFPGSLNTIRALKPQESFPRSSSQRGVGQFNAVHYTPQIKSISYFFH